VLTSERILFRSRRRTGPNFSVPLEEVLAIEAYTRRGTGTVRVITPYGSLTVDQIPGRQGEMLAADARATLRGEPLPARDPLRLLAELRALRDSGAISAAEFEIRKVCDLARDLGDRSGRQRSTILPSAMRKMLTPHKTTLGPVGGSPITDARCVPRGPGKAWRKTRPV
jgi:hypothetical protein